MDPETEGAEAHANWKAPDKTIPAPQNQEKGMEGPAELVTNVEARGQLTTVTNTKTGERHSATRMLTDIKVGEIAQFAFPSLYTSRYDQSSSDLASGIESTKEISKILKNADGSLDAHTRNGDVYHFDYFTKEPEMDKPKPYRRGAHVRSDNW